MPTSYGPRLMRGSRAFTDAKRTVTSAALLQHSPRSDDGTSCRDRVVLDASA